MLIANLGALGESIGINGFMKSYPIEAPSPYQSFLENIGSVKKETKEIIETKKDGGLCLATKRLWS